jgi:hypothetical protein
MNSRTEECAFATRWKAVLAANKFRLKIRSCAFRAEVLGDRDRLVAMKDGVPNHRAALDAGIAFCYLSNDVGPARVSAGR